MSRQSSLDEAVSKSLERYFRVPVSTVHATPGVIDLIEQYKRALSGSGDIGPEAAFRQLPRYICPIAEFGDADLHGGQRRVNETRKRNVIEAGQGDIGRDMDTCLREGIQATQGHHVVGGEYGIGQRAGCQQLLTGAMAGSFVEITGQLDAFGVTAESRQRVTEATQALARVEVEVRARNECNAPMASIEQVAGHRHRAGRGMHGPQQHHRHDRQPHGKDDAQDA